MEDNSDFTEVLEIREYFNYVVWGLLEFKEMIYPAKHGRNQLVEGIRRHIQPCFLNNLL